MMTVDEKVGLPACTGHWWRLKIKGLGCSMLEVSEVFNIRRISHARPMLL